MKTFLELLQSAILFGLICNFAEMSKKHIYTGINIVNKESKYTYDIIKSYYSFIFIFIEIGVCMCVFYNFFIIYIFIHISF